MRKKMISRYSSLLLVYTALALLGMLTVPGGVWGGDSPEVASGSEAQTVTLGRDAQKVTLTYWRHHEGNEVETIKTLIDRFQKLHPHVKIDLLTFPYNVYTTKLVASLSTGEGPDIINIHNSWAYGYIKAGLILRVPSDIVSSQEFQRDFFPMMESFSRHGVYYGIPIGGSNLALFYNKDMFTAAGLEPQHPPATWDELAVMAETMTRREPSGRLTQAGAALGMPDGQGWNYFVEGVLRQNGAGIISDDLRKVLWDSPEGVEALDWYVGFITRRKINSHLLPRDFDSFRLGLSGIMIGGGWNVGQIRKRAPNLNVGTALLPVSPKGIRATYGTFWGNAVTRKTPFEAQKWAWEFIKFMTTYENMKYWSQRTGELPMRRDVLKDEQLKKADPLLGPFIEQLPYSYSSIKKDETTYMWAVSEAMEQMVYNGMDAATALQRAAVTINKMLERE